MKAQEIKDKYLKEDVKDICGIIAIGEGTWFHVHDDEVVPEENFTIAIHPRKYEDESSSLQT